MLPIGGLCCTVVAVVIIVVVYISLCLYMYVMHHDTLYVLFVSCCKLVVSTQTYDINYNRNNTNSVLRIYRQCNNICIEHINKYHFTEDVCCKLVNQLRP